MERGRWTTPSDLFFVCILILIALLIISWMVMAVVVAVVEREADRIIKSIAVCEAEIGALKVRVEVLEKIAHEPPFWLDDAMKGVK